MRNNLETEISNNEGGGNFSPLWAELEKSARMGSLEWDPASSQVVLSEGLCLLLGIVAPSSTLSAFLENIHPADRSSISLYIRGESAGGKEPVTFRLSEDSKDPGVFTASRKVLERDDHERVFLIIRDVTGDKESVQELKEQLQHEREVHGHTRRELEKFNAIIDSSQDAVISIDIPNGNVLTWNLAAEKLYGYSRREIIGRSIYHIIPEDQRKAFVESINNVLLGENIYRLRTERFDSSGTRVLVQMNIFPIRDSKGAIIACYAVARDITDKVIVEEKLKLNETLLRQAEALARMGSWEYSFITKGFTCSEELYRLHGYEPEEVDIDKEFFLGATHPDDRENFSNVLLNIKNMRQTFTLSRRIIRRDGAVRYLHTRGRVVTDHEGRPVKVYGTCQDVTEAREVEEKILKSEAQLKTVQEIAFIGSYEWNALTRKRVWSEETYKIFDIPLSEEPDEDKIIPRIHPADKERVTKVFSGLTSENSYDVEFRLMRPSGGVKYLVSRGRISRDESGNLLGLIGMIQDITERKEAEEKILSQKKFMEDLLENSVDGVMAFDRETVITAWNKGMEDLNNIPRTSVVGKKLFDVFPAYLGTEDENAFLRVLGGEKVSLYRRPFKSGKAGFYEASIVPLHSGKHNEIVGGLCIVRDVTERIRLEEEAMELKLNQHKEILNVILHTQEEERNRIAEALHNGVGQLLYAIRLNLQKDSSERVSTLIEEAIRETRSISFELMPNILKDFGLRVALEEMCSKLTNHSFRIYCDFLGEHKRFDNAMEIAVYRIVQELVNNIVKHSGAPEAYVRIIGKDNYLVLNIQDNGRGFRVKDSANKSGIGLKSIYNRVNLLNGTIKISSAPNKGTEVRIEIPIT